MQSTKSKPEFLAGVTPEETELIYQLVDPEIATEIKRKAVRRIFEILADRERQDAHGAWIN
jgi:hypothetical protein